MIRNASWTVLVLLLPFSHSARAEGASLYRINPAIDVSLISLGVLGAALPDLVSSRLITRHCAPCDPGSVNSLDRHVIGNDRGWAATTSDITVGLAATVPILIDGVDAGSYAEWRDDMTVYAEVLALNGALVNLAKYTVQRPRPWTYAPHDAGRESSPDAFVSFYSGHTSATFAALSAASMNYTYRHGAHPWPWVITGVVGAMVGFERVAAGRHFYTDVATGALVGTGIGILVPWLHHEQRQQATSTSSLSASRLTASPAKGALAMLWSFPF